MQNTNVWKKMYELSDQLVNMQPWQYLWSEDYVCLELSPDDIVYCTIMGRNKECIGLSFYQGDEGYADLCSLSHTYNDIEVTKYVMFEQNSLTWYLGDREEVPAEQRQIMKKLGLTYEGRNQWPYFISYESQYYPSPINEHEAKRFIKVLEVLIKVLQKYIVEKIDVDFDRGEMIHGYWQDQQWICDAMCVPEEIDKFAPIELSDLSVFHQLKGKIKSKQKLYMDLVYLNSYIEDKMFKKPANALMFIVVDGSSEMILHGEILKPGDDEIEVILSFFVPYLLEKTIPQTICLRNPMIYSAIVDICERCNIDMNMTDFSMIDNIMEEIKKTMM